MLRKDPLPGLCAYWQGTCLARRQPFHPLLQCWPGTETRYPLTSSFVSRRAQGTGSLCQGPLAPENPGPFPGTGVPSVLEKREMPEQGYKSQAVFKTFPVDKYCTHTDTQTHTHTHALPPNITQHSCAIHKIIIEIMET